MAAGPSNCSTRLKMEDKNTADEHQMDRPAKRIRCSSDVDDVRHNEDRATEERRSGASPVLEKAADLELDPGVSEEDTGWSWRYSPPMIGSRPQLSTHPDHLRAAETNTGAPGPYQRQKQLQNNFDPLSATTDGLPVSNSSNIGLPGSLPSSSLDFKKALGEFAAHRRAAPVSVIGEGVPKMARGRHRKRRRVERTCLDAKRFIENTPTPGSSPAAVSSLDIAAMSEPCSEAAQKVRNDAAGFLTPGTHNTAEFTNKISYHSGLVTTSPAGSSPAVTTVTDVQAKEQCDVDTIGGESPRTRNSPGVKSDTNSTTSSPHCLVLCLGGDTADEPIIIGDDGPAGAAGNMVHADVFTLVKDKDLTPSTEGRPLEAVSNREDITVQDEQILGSGVGKVNTSLDPVPSLDPSLGVRASTHTVLILASHNASLSATAAIPSVALNLYQNPNLLPRPGLTFCTTVPYVTGALSRFIHFYTTSGLLDLLTLICLKHNLTSHDRSRISCFYLTYGDNTLVIDLCDPDCEWDWEAWMGSVGKWGGVVSVNVMLGSDPVNRYISAPGHLIMRGDEVLE